MIFKLERSPLGIAAGDVFGTQGGGAVGRVIQMGTRSDTAHNGIFIKLIKVCEDGSEDWLTHEAFGSDGLHERIRNTSKEPMEIHTVARHAKEQARIVEASSRLVAVSKGYDWIEILRIAIWFIGDIFSQFKLQFIADKIKAFAGWVHKFNKWDKFICSNHTANCIFQIRPDVKEFTSYKANEIWPGELMRSLRLLARKDFLEFFK